MSAIALKKNSDPTTHGRFDRLKRSLRTLKVNGKKLTRSQQAICGRIDTFGGKKRKKSMCKLPNKQMEKDFGTSPATNSTAIQFLLDAEIIEKVERDFEGTGYRCVKTLLGKGYDVIPHYFYTATINIDGEWQKMRSTDVITLAHVVGQALQQHENLQEILASPALSMEIKKDEMNKATLTYKKVDNKSLANTLGMSKKTLNNALARLVKAGILEQTKEQKGKNAHFYSEFTVKDKSVYDYIFAEKPQKEQQETPAQAAARKEEQRIDAANARTDRDSYYAKKKQKAWTPVYKVLDKLGKMPEWNEVATRLRTIEADMAKYEYANEGRKSVGLEVEQALLLERKKKLLRRFGYTEVDLQPKFACKWCSDTGWLPDGRSCTCYSKRQE